jgi:hypothetical protein
MVWAGTLKLTGKCVPQSQDDFYVPVLQGLGSPFAATDVVRSVFQMENPEDALRTRPCIPSSVSPVPMFRTSICGVSVASRYVFVDF